MSPGNTSNLNVKFNNKRPDNQGLQRWLRGVVKTLAALAEDLGCSSQNPYGAHNHLFQGT